MELLIGLGVIAAGLALTLALPVISFVRSVRATKAADELKREVEVLRRQIDDLRQELGFGAHRFRETGSAEAPKPWPWSAPDAEHRGEPAAAPAVDGVATAGSTPAADARLASTPAVPAVLETLGSPPLLSDAAVRGSSSTPAEGVAGADRPRRHHATLEERIGARWLLYVAMASLLLGASYFVKYAFENEWVTPFMRVVLGGIAGGALVEGGRRVATRGLAFFGQVLCGGGVAILYLSVYAAFNFYGLVSPGLAFALMVTVTALGASLAVRHRSQALALLAVIGGFATPFLVSTGRDAQVALFTYDAVLVAGTMYLARRGGWPALNLVSFLLTGVTLVAWLAAHYRPAKWVTTQLFFTLFCAMFVYIQRQTWRTATPFARAVATLLALGPLAYHAASLGILALHPLWSLVYLIAFTAVGVIAAAHWNSSWLRLGAFVLVALPAFAWMARYSAASWLLPGTIAIVAIYGIHLLAGLRAASAERDRLSAPETLLLHGGGGWLCGALAALYAPHHGAWLGTIAAVLAAWNGTIALAQRPRALEAWVHHLALAFALAAIAVALEFDGAWVTVGWAAEGAALIWIGLRLSRTWLRVGGGLLLAVSLARLAHELLEPGAVADLPVLNPRSLAAVFVITLLYWVAALHQRHRPGLAGAGRAEVAALLVAAHALTLLLITAEIEAVFQKRAWTGSLGAGGAGAATTADLARDVSLSTAWAAYALGLVAAGIRQRYAPIRYLAIGVFAVTVAKVFLVDLARLDRIWRILSMIGLGVLLLGASYLYQRFAAGEDAERAPW